MSPTTEELLAHSNKVNRNIVARDMPEPTGVSLPDPDPAKAVLDDPDADPFAGNLNNRRVAERIAKGKTRKYLSNSMPTHLGDPNKAAADVAKSKAVNPTPPDVDGENLPPIPLVAQVPVPEAGESAGEALNAKTGNKPPKKAPGNAEPKAWKPNA